MPMNNHRAGWVGVTRFFGELCQIRTFGRRSSCREGAFRVSPASDGKIKTPCSHSTLRYLRGQAVRHAISTVNWPRGRSGPKEKAGANQAFA